MSSPAESAIATYESTRDAALQRVKDLLAIPTVSTDPAFAEDMQRGADWCANRLREIGFEATVHGTDKHPIVTAEAGPTDGPTVLYYGHYDVQPADPLELWHSSPFDPQVVQGPHGDRIVARGAVDDKGQLMTFIEAFAAWQATHGEFPIRVKVILEGEEECGSPSLPGFLDQEKELLAADTCVVCDTGMWDVNTPAITTSLRGLVYIQVRLHGPGSDLHSGMFGGTVPNPAMLLSKVIAQLHDDNLRVAVPGFYDGIRPPDQDRIDSWYALGFDDKEFLATAGLETDLGEEGTRVLERIWSRPTVEVNGLCAGYTGEGAKTVIGAHATAKISCRLIAGQNAENIRDALKQFFLDRTPKGCRWEITEFGAEDAFEVDGDSPWLAAAQEGLQAQFGKPAAMVGSGGSIPVCGLIREHLGFESLLVGFGLDDDGTHAPNEKFERVCFDNGVKSHLRMLESFAKVDS